MAFLSYLKFPFKSILTGYRSYKFFNALMNSKDKKLLTMIRNYKNLFDLQEIYTYLSPLHVLIREGKSELAAEVMKRPDAATGVNLQNNPQKFAPVHVAAKYGAAWVLPDMHQLRCNFMIKNEQGTSPIHIAAAEGFNEFIELLLEYGIQIDDKDSIGYTALFYAVLFSKLDTIKLLLEKGAKPGSQCNIGSTPLLNAVMKNDLEITKYLYRFKDGHKFKADYRLVHIAAGQSTPDILRWLHEQGEDIKQLDNSENRLSALHYAAAGKSPGCIKYLLSQGFYANTTDATGSTPLHTAVIQMDYDCIRILCEARASLTIKNDSYMSPLDIAESMREPKLVSYLKLNEKTR